MLKKFIFIITSVILFINFPLCASALSRNEILMKGDNDKYVLELQKALCDQGFLKAKPTGYFGTDTVEALIAFQKSKGLKADGKAGPETRQVLLGGGYKPITEERKTEKKSADKIYPGDKGDDVKEIQQYLQKLGYYKYTKITGYYGPSTEEAVKRFQKTNNLNADGVTDSSTLNLLKSKEAKSYTIYYKDKGSDIEQMQTRLKQLGYYKQKITGYFGSYTLEILKTFQKNNGLKSDGKAGKNTLEVLYSKKAVRAAKGAKITIPKAEVDGATIIEKAINFAKTLAGKKYRRGAEGPERFDCSGFTTYVMKYVGLKLPRTSRNMSMMEQYQKIENPAGLVAGDLMFFRTSKKSSIGHVGIYIGGNQFIHAAPGVGVEIKGFTAGSYYYRQFRWGRRIF